MVATEADRRQITSQQERNETFHLVQHRLTQPHREVVGGEERSGENSRPLSLRKPDASEKRAARISGGASLAPRT